MSIINCDFECDDICINCSVKEVTHRIYSNIKDYEEGEVTDEWVEENFDKFKHERIDSFVCELKQDPCERILYNYGIDKAIRDYDDTYGEIHIENFSRKIVYNLIDINLELSVENYKLWKESEESEEESEGESEESEVNIVNIVNIVNMISF